MYTINGSFSEFDARISIGNAAFETATNRAVAISEMLRGHFDILGLFATGSFIRGTGLRNRSDVDVIVVLHYAKHIQGLSPVAVLENVRLALSGYNARIVKKNGQAVTLYFKTWPNVDIVPAKRVSLNGGSYALEIADANTGRWLRTDPAAHDRKMEDLTSRGRALVRMVKWWNEVHSSYFRSYDIERVAINLWSAYETSMWGEDGWPWALRQFFNKAIELTAPAAEISHDYDPRPWLELRARLLRAEETSLDAWWAVRNNETPRAIERLRILFGDRFPRYGS